MVCIWNLIRADERFVDFMTQSGPLVAQNRNAIVKAFLAHERLPEWLLFVDNDEDFPTWGPSKAMEIAKKVGTKILGCSVMLSSYYEGLFRRHPKGGYEPIRDLEANRIYRHLGAVGTGFLLLHREVLEVMALKYPAWAPWFWFDLDIVNGEEQPLGEDTTFCRRAEACGFEITGFTGIPIVHHKRQAMLSKFMKATLPLKNAKLAASWR
jgi:hypothetical protein